MARTPIGFQEVIRRMGLRVPAPERPANTDSGVNKRIETDSELLFPTSVAIDDSPIGHLEFGLRNEGVNLALIAAALKQIPPEDLQDRLKEKPNSEYIRRLAFWWESLHPGQPLDAAEPSGGYVALFPEKDYIVAKNPERYQRFRVWDNALGNADFCPVVRRPDHPGEEALETVLDQARKLMARTEPRDYERANQYLYLSETEHSFNIENDTPDADRSARFMELLSRAGSPEAIDEDYLITIQQAAVKHPVYKETSYRLKQNWLSRSSGPILRVDYFPPPSDDLRSMMSGWERFANDKTRGIDPLTHIAATSFGFVYLHPFLDGNGRIHRFLIHEMLVRSGLAPDDTIIPVSAVIINKMEEYAAVLNHFSKPINKLWNYSRGEEGPIVKQSADPAVYRYPDMGRETSFLNKMLSLAVTKEMPHEIRWLKNFDTAYKSINDTYDIPSQDAHLLIRLIEQNGGVLSKRKRRKFDLVPEDKIQKIEQIVREAFADKPIDANLNEDEGIGPGRR